MSTIGRKSKVVDSVVGNLPGGYRVGFLVPRVDGLFHEKRSVVFVRAFRMADEGMAFFGHESGVVPFLVVYYQRSIHVGGQEEILGSW